ncbi:MAG: hypothetical protein HY683_09940 [Chloroflexi bacterium]|nr:hypothetical protein [Chloroflexota bacterium]
MAVLSGLGGVLPVGHETLAQDSGAQSYLVLNPAEGQAAPDCPDGVLRVVIPPTAQLRDAPAADAAVVGSLEQGQVVCVLGQDPQGWAKLQSPANPQQLAYTEWDTFRTVRVLVAEGASPASEAPVPTGLRCTPGVGQVMLDWNALAGASSYILYMATTPWTAWAATLPGAMRHDGIAQASFGHTGLAGGTTYSFAVAAVVEGVEGPQSSRVSCTPVSPTPTPTPVSSGVVGSGGMVVSQSLTVRGGQMVSATGGLVTVSDKGTAFTVAAETTAGSSFIVRLILSNASNAPLVGEIRFELPPEFQVKVAKNPADPTGVTGIGQVGLGTWKFIMNGPHSNAAWDVAFTIKVPAEGAVGFSGFKGTLKQVAA